MELDKVKQFFGDIDIYLLDQIFKDRYARQDKILDAGCGEGRNLKWFYHNKYDCYAIDQDSERLDVLKDHYPRMATNVIQTDLRDMPFKTQTFDHVICSAVLHFAEDYLAFDQMFTELVRVLKPNGSLFIRMASNIGIENLVIPVSEDLYLLPDGTQRFLLTRSLWEHLPERYGLLVLEPLKTVNVGDLRCMSTLVLQKK